MWWRKSQARYRSWISGIWWRSKTGAGFDRIHDRYTRYGVFVLFIRDQKERLRILELCWLNSSSTGKNSGSSSRMAYLNEAVELPADEASSHQPPKPGRKSCWALKGQLWTGDRAGESPIDAGDSWCFLTDQAWQYIDGVYASKGMKAPKKAKNRYSRHQDHCLRQQLFFQLN